MAPALLQVYRSLIHTQWRTLELIENTERVIHRVVRIQNPGARPPELTVRRIGPEEIEVVYRSARRMCALARGIVRGLATHYGERIRVGDRSCMLKGDPECVISVAREAEKPSASRGRRRRPRP